MLVRFCLILFCWALSPAAAQAQAFAPPAAAATMRGLTISADESDRDIEADTLDLRGNVQIMFKDQHMSCERARINFRAKTIDASGQVKISSTKAEVGGDRIYLDYESNTGVIYYGYVQSGNVYFEGELITRTSETDYLAEKAKFTTCTNCPESWSFAGQRIRAELGGYAYMKNSFLKFGGWPLLWLPYLVVPLKSDRQTGLLTPEIESSESGGLTLSESFFWAMGRSHDSTWTLKNYELRGLKNLVNYRYMLSEHSHGEMDLGMLRDRVFASDQRLNAFRSPSEQGEIVNRWFLKYEHYYELPEGYVHRLQLNNASDLQYPKDFPLETRNHGDSAMENRMSLTKNSKNQHFSLDSSYYVNLLQADPLAGNSDAVHRLPELRFSQTMTPIGETSFLYTTDLNYVNFARSDFAYDDMNRGPDPANPEGRYIESTCDKPDWYNDPACQRLRDGQFDPDRDLIRTGQRLDFQGTLYRPLKIGDNVDVLPKLAFRETQYQFNVGDQLSNHRRYVRAEVEARSVFSRVFGRTGSGSFERLKHEIEPSVTFTTIPWISHPSHPFFGAEQESPFFSQEHLSDSDLGSPYGIQFDYNDRVYDRKLMTFGFTNKLTQKRWVQGNPEYRQVVFWKLAQSYDFYQAESNSDTKQPLSDVFSVLRVNFDSVEAYQRANYFPYQQVTNSSTRVRLKNELNDFIELSHLISYNITPGQEADITGRTEDLTLSVRKTFSYLDLMGRTTYDVNPQPGREDQRFKSYGYGAQVKLPGDCWFFTITQYRTTGGDDNFRLNFDFIWDGQKKPALPEDLLNNLGF